MENNDRARQFLPFDALKGFKEALKEREINTVEKILLTEEKEKELSYYLSQTKRLMMVKIVYYNNSSYIEVKGIVTKIDLIDKSITIVKNKIYLKDILYIESNDFIPYENNV